MFTKDMSYFRVIERNNISVAITRYLYVGNGMRFFLCNVCHNAITLDKVSVSRQVCICDNPLCQYHKGLLYDDHIDKMKITYEIRNSRQVFFENGKVLTYCKILFQCTAYE